MSAEDLEQYESELELQLYREYKDVVGIFTYAVETERRFYLCNAVDLKVRTEGGDVYYEVSMADAWVWTCTARRASSRVPRSSPSVTSPSRKSRTATFRSRRVSPAPTSSALLPQGR